MIFFSASTIRSTKLFHLPLDVLHLWTHSRFSTSGLLPTSFVPHGFTVHFARSSIAFQSKSANGPLLPVSLLVLYHSSSYSGLCRLCHNFCCYISVPISSLLASALHLTLSWPMPSHQPSSFFPLRPRLHHCLNISYLTTLFSSSVISDLSLTL